jgi:hypothetical protein
MNLPEDFGKMTMGDLINKFKSKFRRFSRNEDGLASAEMVMMLPFYMFCILGTFTFWDAYDVVNRSQKAAYSVSDLVTRKQDNVTEVYVEGMFNTMQYMMGPSLPVRTRITSVFYSQARNQYEVLWSRSSTPTIPRLTTATLPSVQSHLPQMSDGDALIVVEANVDFKPIFGAEAFAMTRVNAGTMRHVIVTRPRFLPKICMQGVACG